MTVEIRIVRKLRDYVLDVDLTMPDGDVLVLFGRNGSGKSTLLRMVAGLMTPDEGRIVVGGRTFFDSSRGINLPPEERNVGFMFQNYAVFPHITVYNNLAYGLRIKKVKETDVLALLRPLMERYGLWDVRDVKAGRLSGGQKQRTALLRSLVVQPSIFLLDEPLSAMDRAAHVSARKEIKDLMREMKVPGIVVTHDQNDALDLGNSICFIDRGKIEQCLVPESLAAAADREVFFGSQNEPSSTNVATNKPSPVP